VVRVEALITEGSEAAMGYLGSDEQQPTRKNLPEELWVFGGGKLFEGESGRGWLHGNTESWDCLDGGIDIILSVLSRLLTIS
jgi:hypothetical protein